MNLSAEVLTPWFSGIAWVIYALLLASAIYFAPFRAVMVDPRKQHFAFAGTVALALFWLLEIKITAALSIHPLLVTAVVLIFGWCLSLIMGSIALIALTVLGRSDLMAFPVNAFVTVIIPASVTWLVLVLVSSSRFKNIFLYILGAGFAGAALSVLICALAVSGLIALIDSPLLPSIDASNWPLLLLLMFPEGFINGTLVSATTVFLPDLVKTFDDRRYLDNGEE